MGGGVGGGDGRCRWGAGGSAVAPRLTMSLRVLQSRMVTSSGADDGEPLAACEGGVGVGGSAEPPLASLPVVAPLLQPAKACCKALTRPATSATHVLPVAQKASNSPTPPEAVRTCRPCRRLPSPGRPESLTERYAPAAACFLCKRRDRRQPTLPAERPPLQRKWANPGFSLHVEGSIAG